MRNLPRFFIVAMFGLLLLPVAAFAQFDLDLAMLQARNNAQNFDEEQNDAWGNSLFTQAQVAVAPNPLINAFGNMGQAFGVPVNPFNAAGAFGTTATAADPSAWNFNLADYLLGIYSPPLPDTGAGSMAQQGSPAPIASSTPCPYADDRCAFWK